LKPLALILPQRKSWYASLKIPMPINLKALQIAHEEGVKTIFNPAPARPQLPEELYQLSDIFCPMKLKPSF
jgi:ribokinase